MKIKTLEVSTEVKGQERKYRKVKGQIKYTGKSGQAEN